MNHRDHRGHGGKPHWIESNPWRCVTRSIEAVLLFSVVSVVSVVHSFDFAPVTPGKALQFPRDTGSHPDHRIEWWYVTGQLDTKHGPMGFQVTFFRLRNPGADANPSRFSPRELLFAHAALADPRKGRLAHDQRSARSLEGLVEAKLSATDVRIDDWYLKREALAYRTRIDAEAFALDLVLTPTQRVLAQGDAGYSRKGPLKTQASYYYSEPQLRVSGRVRSGSETLEAHGMAWLDHEWSSEYLAPGAQGWDWVGANLDGGGALMAFAIRGEDGKALWAGGTLRIPGEPPVVFAPGDVAFTPRRGWKSPRTGVSYPIAMDLRAGTRTWRLEPLMDDQEMDARGSTGTLYWEGAVRMESSAGVKARGYLELTGYAEKLKL
jgi:predicted secreted hydrolase